MLVFLPRKQGDLITEVIEPQSLISLHVLSAQVTSLKDCLWSHLCLDPIFQKGAMWVTMHQGQQKGAIGQKIWVRALEICRGCPQEVSCS